jgi:hypothetical protein
MPGAATAAQSVSLTTVLSPERLGRSTTLYFDFQISAAVDAVPSPLTELDVRYPPGFGVAASGLGLETCTATTLELLGPSGCPTDSRVGYGTALAEVPFTHEIVREAATVAVIRAPAQSGHTALLFYAEGLSPVFAFVVFPGVLWRAPPPFGGEIRMAVPLVPALPGGPDVSVVHVSSTIGPAHLTYYEDVHGRRIPYTPRGIVLPVRCPKGGFPFAATFGFLDGSRATARSTVRCPRTRKSHMRAVHRGSRGRQWVGFSA